jgi:hypothetical protein
MKRILFFYEGNLDSNLRISIYDLLKKAGLEPKSETISFNNGSCTGELCYVSVLKEDLDYELNLKNLIECSGLEIKFSVLEDGK